MSRKKNVPAASWNDAGKYGLYFIVFFSFLIFTTVNTTAFVAPKSFFIRAGAFVLSIYYIWTCGIRFRASRLNFPLFCFFMSLLVSTAASGNVLVSLFRLSEYAAYFAIFALTVNYLGRDDARSAASWLTWIALPIALYGWAQYFQIDFSFWERPEGRMDMFSTIGNVNWFGAFLAGVIPLMIHGASERRLMAFQLPALLVSVAAVVATHSRASFFAMALSFAFGAAVYLYCNSWRLTPAAKAVSFSVLAAVVIMAAVFSYRNYFSAYRFEHGFASRMMSGFTLADHNVAQRLFVWRVAARMFSDNWLLGMGPGMFKVRYLDYQSGLLASLGNDPAYDTLAGNAKEAHNEYVQMATECGLAGLFCMLFFVASVFRVSLSHILDPSNDRRDRSLALAVLMGLFALAADSMADFPLHVPCNGALFFFLAGLACVISEDPGAGEYFDAAAGAGSQNYAFTLKFGATAAIAIALIFLVALPFVADVYSVKGQLYLKTHDFAGAIPWFRDSLSLNPAQGDTLYLLGTAMVGLATSRPNSTDGEMMSRGEEFIKKALQYAGDKGMYNNLGFISIRKKDTDSAIRYFEKAIGCDPRSSDSLNNMGTVYMSRGDLERAEGYFRKALKCNEYFLTAINNLGDLFVRQKKYDEALTQYFTVIGSSVEVVIEQNIRKNVYNFNRVTYGSELGRAAYQVAEIKAAAGNQAEAARYYEMAFANVRDLPQIPFKLGTTYIRLGRTDEGRRLLEYVLSATPEGSEYNRRAREALGR